MTRVPASARVVSAERFAAYPRGEHERGGGAGQRRERGLELVVHVERAGDQPGGAGSAAVGLGRGHRTRDDGRMGAQPEVVVAGEVEAVTALGGGEPPGEPRGLTGRGGVPDPVEGARHGVDPATRPRMRPARVPPQRVICDNCLTQVAARRHPRFVPLSRYNGGRHGRGPARTADRARRARPRPAASGRRHRGGQRAQRGRGDRPAHPAMARGRPAARSGWRRSCSSSSAIGSTPSAGPPPWRRPPSARACSSAPSPAS